MKRLLILLLALATMTALPGQPGMLLVGDAAAPPPAQLLLDQYPGATGAWSLRLLRTTYTGNCIQVRRLSDSQTSNIGFSGGVIDTNSLKIFCASTSCVVTTWYDQSNTTQNLTQTTLTSQPLIVLSGIVIREGNEPAIDFDGINDLLLGANMFNFITNSTYSSFTVALLDTIITDAGESYSNTGIFGDTGGYAGLYARRNPNRLLFYNWDNNDDRATININLDTEYIIHQRHEAGNIVGSINNSTEASVLSGATSQTQALRVGAGFSSTFMNGTVKELIFWNTNQSGNITGIYNNINTFYSIF